MSIKAAREPDLHAKRVGFVYQVQAVEATKDLPFAAVFHEQGLGKTKIGTDVALYWLSHGVVDSVMVVTKRGLIQNWSDELKIHSHVQPRLLSQDRRANFLAFNSPARIYLTHYEVLKSELSRLKLFLRTRKVGVILDEAHKIKNPDSTVADALFQLSSSFERRLIMTGTPVANRPYDLWAQIYFLDGGASLGTDFQSFRHSLDLSNDLARNLDKAQRFEETLAGVFKKISAFTVRETKASADIQLPTKEIRSVSVDLESRQSELYRQFRDEFAAIVVKRGIPQMDEAEEILKRLLRLVQVASNPRLIDHAYHGVPAKLPVLRDLVESVIDKDEKIIVWSAFTENVDWIARELREFHAVRVHGKLSYEERNRSIKLFKENPDCQILVATPAAAKEGLTLTVANNAVFFDRSFSLDDYLQAQDRIHRISQEKPCVVTNLIAAGTVDEWVDVLLAAKQLAAQLGQGDITREQYAAAATYAFGDMIKEILGMKDDSDGQ